MDCKSAVTVTENIIQNTLNYFERPALHYTIKYPYFISEDCVNSLAHLNNHYNSKALDFRSYAQNILYQDAVNAQKCKPGNYLDFIPFELLVTYNVTYNSNGLLSLYYDQYIFKGGAHGLTSRASDTWKLKGAEKLDLDDFFPLNENYQKDIKAEILRQAESAEKDGTALFLNNYSQRIEEHFDIHNFFLSQNPNRVTVYFQEYEITPYVMGIPMFDILLDSKS